MPFHMPLQDLTARNGSQADIVSALRAASNETGARFDTLMASAQIESGMNPQAKASSSSATGLFQFIDQTWLDAVRQYGPSHGLSAEAASIVRRGDRLTVDDPQARQRILDLRKDPKLSATLAGEHIQSLSSKLQSVLGRAPDATETYLGHFLGTGGASQLLQTAQSAPNRAAADILPDAARANPSVFYGAGGSPYTISQMIDRLRARVERAYAEIGAPVPQTTLTRTAAVGGKTADAPDAGSNGWGTTTPRKVASMSEKLMAANLADVFARVDRGLHHAGQRGHKPNELPGAVVQALGAQDGST